MCLKLERLWSFGVVILGHRSMPAVTCSCTESVFSSFLWEAKWVWCWLVRFVRSVVLAQIRFIKEERISVEEKPPSDWPVGKPLWEHFLD